MCMVSGTSKEVSVLPVGTSSEITLEDVSGDGGVVGYHCSRSVVASTAAGFFQEWLSNPVLDVSSSF